MLFTDGQPWLLASADRHGGLGHNGDGTLNLTCLRPFSFLFNQILAIAAASLLVFVSGVVIYSPLWSGRLTPSPSTSGRS